MEHIKLNINSNIQDFINAVEGMSKGDDGAVRYTYVAGYYESMLSHLAKDFPEVADVIQRRVQYIEQTKKVAA